MTVTTARIIAGFNLLVLAAGYAVGFSAGASDPRRSVALIVPLVLIAGNMLLGLACLLAMGFFHIIEDREKARAADRLMQAFMISFGLVLSISIPACTIGAGLK